MQWEGTDSVHKPYDRRFIAEKRRLRRTLVPSNLGVVHTSLRLRCVVAPRPMYRPVVWHRPGLGPMASKLVGRLEDRLGVRLLQRTTRQLTFTEPVRAYFERCSAAMRALQDAETEATALQTSPQGRLRITLPTAFAVSYLAVPLAEFKARYPGLTIEAVLDDRKVDIKAEGFDLAVRIGELTDSALIARRLTTVERTVCASPSYLNKGPNRESLVEVTGTLVSKHREILVEAACHGLGLVFSPMFLTAANLRCGRLVRVLPDWQFPLAVSAMFPMLDTFQPRCGSLWIFRLRTFRPIRGRTSAKRSFIFSPQCLS